MQRLVFSDLDGSLLDHYSYRFDEARPALDELAKRDIPLILASSKTRSEMLQWRQALDNTHPFIVENGAAVFIPQDYFHAPPEDTRLEGDYLVHEMAPPRRKWLDVLASLDPLFPGQFASFHSAGIAGVIEMTGLSEAQAIAACDRAYSEPVEWRGTEQEQEQFLLQLRAAGATVARGGRFLAVSGDCNKGRALKWLRDQYMDAPKQGDIEDLAIGDSDNDRAMLEAARTALVIRSPVHDFPVLDSRGEVILSNLFGPAGWSEGVLSWLQSQNFSQQE